ncbi:MAG: peptidylprolyl isomerase [Porticoccaceae bacterium]|nr:peptidylprolyl isomerase [Porticoccaceae bacterium]
MKQWKIFSAALIVCCSMTTATQSLAEIQILDRVIAIVDDDIVLQSELDQRIAAVYAQIQQSETQAPPPEVLGPQVLERLISERLQLNMGYNAGVRITDAELNEALERIAGNAGLSLTDYLTAVQQQGSIVSAMREQVRHEMILMRVQQGQVMRRIRISPQELDNFLESEEGRFLTSPDVNLGQILLSVPTGAGSEQVEAIAARARELLDQAQTGDFKQLAMSYSADQTALEGGDLGWRKLAQLPGVFIEAVEDLEIGAISAPIRSGAGYHLLKLYERRGGDEQLIEQHFARHILIAPNQIRNDESTVNQLEELRQKVANGENFAILAKEYSEDAGSALNGGELGWSTPGMFVPEFEQTMNTIAIDEISRPFRSQFGWHIMQVTERRQQDFSDDIMRNRAQNLLRQRKYEEELQVWLQEIRDEAFIEIKSDNAS